uniref:Uncharacterized protein n=1 Tax=Arundo donax TaxID=35708 RepID=A0A0A9DSS3_ARUDO
MFDIESLSMSLWTTFMLSRVSLVQFTGTKTRKAKIVIGTNILSPVRYILRYTTESSPAWLINSSWGILRAAGIQFKNFKYDLASKLTNFCTAAPEKIGLSLMPLRYHFGK